MMTEDVKPPKWHHNRSKSAASDLANEVRESPARPRLPRTHSKRKAEPTTSDEATTAFVRRVLCSHHIRSGNNAEGGEKTTLPPLEELLPPLTSSNEIDLQLYALIAIILKDFVQVWYSKITPDQQFTDEVIQIIAHCTRALEQRLRHVDLEALILDEVPALIDAHITANRVARGGLFTTSLGTEPRELYHAIHPHPALSPVPLEYGSPVHLEQVENEAAWRHLLIQAALALLLPPEDLENPCLRVLVTEVVSELIVGNAVCGKLCEGWFIWEIVIKLIDLTNPPVRTENNSANPSAVPSRLEQFGLLSHDETSDAAQSGHEPTAGPIDTLLSTFWQIIRYLSILCLGIRSIVTSFAVSATLPKRTFEAPFSGSGESTSNLIDVPSQELSRRTADRPVLGMSMWGCCFHLLSLDLRMPWLTAICGFLQWLLICGPFKVGCTNSRLDRLLSHQIAVTLLDPTRLPLLLMVIRTNIFPNNTLGQGRATPSESEALEIRHQCASTIVEAMPALVRSTLFASEDPITIASEVEEMLESFGDAYINKHVLFALLDLFFSQLFPEIQERDVSAILESVESGA